METDGQQATSRLRSRPVSCLVVLTVVLLLVSLAAVGLILVRADRVGQPAFSFLGWNLFLAWIPYLLALCVAGGYRRGAPRTLLWLLGVTWLIFLPNAPYILTDFIHLGRTGGAPLWFDAVLIGSFGLAGLSLGLASLLVVHHVVEASAGARAGWLLATGSLVLSALGIYLGRFPRFNSWDLITDPGGLATVILGRLADPFGNPFLLRFAAGMSIVLLLSYLVFWVVKRGLWGPVRVSERSAQSRATGQP